MCLCVYFIIHDPYKLTYKIKSCSMNLTFKLHWAQNISQIFSPILKIVTLTDKPPKYPSWILEKRMTYVVLNYCYCRIFFFCMSLFLFVRSNEVFRHLKTWNIANYTKFFFVQNNFCWLMVVERFGGGCGNVGVKMLLVIHKRKIRKVLHKYIDD